MPGNTIAMGPSLTCDNVMIKWLSQRNGPNQVRIRVEGKHQFYEFCVLEVLDNGVLVIRPLTNIYLEDKKTPLAKEDWAKLDDVCKPQ